MTYEQAVAKQAAYAAVGKRYLIMQDHQSLRYYLVPA